MSLAETETPSLFDDLELTPRVVAPADDRPITPRPMSIFAGMLWDRIHKHEKNAVIVITGPSGSGKSMAALTLCHAVDQYFGEEGVYFDPQRLVHDAANLPRRRGRASMFDEAGVGVHNRAWRDITNTSLIHLLQTWRVDGQLLVLTVPYKSFLDSQVIKQCHYWIEMSDTMRGVAKLKTIVQKEELRGNPTWFPFVRAELENGRRVRVNPLVFKLPPVELRDWYEAESRVFKHDLQTKLHIDLEEAKGSLGKVNVEAVAGEIVEKMRKDSNLYRRLLKNGSRKLDREAIKRDYKLPHSKAQSVFAAVQADLPNL